ncbi:sporulation and spore germination protein [Natranaerovirga hydrolytica]|uniref:Sporulation and spore germination protein n=1 Tax=Natranaerovirga hydrolytica TaxID=680378 RepID=A0A4R1MJ23_9FIRM|nr:GerMN domain-containing protein [Natranaerovirga hydrolytica]TCK92748.1 sporulation and spore germination protein [Natranaerovirga hydrolytica]
MKKISLFLILMLTVTLLTACNTTQRNEEPPTNGNGNTIDNGNDNQDNNDENNENDNDINNEQERVELTLYYVNDAYVESGDEALDILIPVKREVERNNQTLEKIVLEQVQNDPQEDGLSTAINELEIINIEIVDGTLNIDISGENLGGGSLQERLVINQIVYNFTELETIDSVQFLIDGIISESLMGHISIDKPITREDTL